MTIQVTPCDVKSFTNTNMSDEAINGLICVVQAKIGECVESAYDECVGKQVLIYATAHMLESQEGSITSEKAANGSSVNYEYYGTGEGVKSTSAGRMLVMLDSAGCYNNLFVSPLVFMSIGDPASPC